MLIDFGRGRGREIDVKEKHGSVASPLCPDQGLNQTHNLWTWGMTCHPTEPPGQGLIFVTFYIGMLRFFLLSTGLF